MECNEKDYTINEEDYTINEEDYTINEDYKLLIIPTGKKQNAGKSEEEDERVVRNVYDPLWHTSRYYFFKFAGSLSFTL